MLADLLALRWVEVISILRVASAIAWLTVLIILLPSVWRVIRGKARFYDMLWTMIAGAAFQASGFNLRWFLAADSGLIYSDLYVFSILLGSVSIAVVRSYQGARNG